MLLARDELVKPRPVELVEELRVRVGREPDVRWRTPELSRRRVSDDGVHLPLPPADLAKEKSQHLESSGRVSLRMVSDLFLCGRRYVDIKRDRRSQPYFEQFLLHRGKPLVRLG